MVQARFSQSGVARVSTLRLKAHSRHAATFEWRESESRIRAIGSLNDRTDVGYLFSRLTRHARGSREANRKSAVSRGWHTIGTQNKGTGSSQKIAGCP